MGSAYLANMVRTQFRWSKHIEKRHVYSLGTRVGQITTILETIKKNLEINELDKIWYMIEHYGVV